MGFLSGFQDATRYAFHATARDNLPSIRAEGLDPTAGTKPGASDILTVLDELGFDDPFPFNRAAVTYCHVDADYVTGAFAELDGSGLSSDRVVVVVDLTNISAPMYLADMSIITDLIDYRCAGPEQMLHADTPTGVIDQYRDSITKVTDTAQIPAYDTESTHTELVIDGTVPADAIAAVRDPHADIPSP